MKKNIFLGFVFCFLQLACNRQEQLQENVDLIPPETFDAKQFEVPREKMAAPVVTPAKEVKGKYISAPEVFKIESNVFPVERSSKTIATSKICIPGKNGYKLPTTVPAVDCVYAAGSPKVVLIKDVQIHENNHGSFTPFTTLQGLPSNLVSTIMEDKAGNIWLGTIEGGLSKFDGRSFTNYTTATGLINEGLAFVMEDRTGNLWIGYWGYGGFSKFDGKSFTHYSCNRVLNGKSVVCMLQDKKGDYWIGTDRGGVFKFDGINFTHYGTEQGLPGNLVTGITEDSKGNLWFGTEQGISMFDGLTFFNYSVGEGNQIINAMLADSKGNIWISRGGEGLDKFDGQSFKHFTIMPNGPANLVTRIIEDHKGNLWLGTYGGGLIKYDGNFFTQFTNRQGLNSNFVSVLEDKHGIFWITTSYGLCRYDGETFTHFNKEQGISEGNFHSIVVDKNGAVWCGLFAGALNKYDRNLVTKYNSNQGLSNDLVASLMIDREEKLWIGTHGAGINQFDGFNFTQFLNITRGTSVWFVFQDSRRNIWFATSRGLEKYDGKNFTHFGVAQGLSHEAICSIAEDKKGNLWVGTEQGIVNKLELADSSNERYTMRHYKISPDNGPCLIYSILSDKKNNLWFGTSNAGLVKFDGQSFQRFTTSQGLSNNSVNSIIEDKKDNLWFLTKNGLGKMAAEGSDSIQRKGVEHSRISYFSNYLFSDGFFGIGSHFNTMALDPDGNIWIGTVNQMTRFNFEGDIADTIPPSIELSSLSLYSENVNWLDLSKNKDSGLLLSNGIQLHDLRFKELSKWNDIPQDLKLPYDNNYVSFQFIGVTTKKASHVKYKYKLEGLDNKWSALTSQPEAVYNNLPPNNYVFKVKAVNSEGYWSPELKYAFSVHPPWWETWWFRIPVAVFLIDLLYAIIRRRIKHKFKLQLAQSEKETQLAEMRQEKAELQQQATELEMQALRAQMNPHFIFNSLNSINRFILQNNRLQASEYLTKFSKLVRIILQNSQVSLVPLESELEAMELYLDLESLRFDHRFGYKISVPSDMDKEVIKVPPLIIQPYAENAIWHGLMHKEEKGQLDIEVSEESEHLYFKIADNGIGRKQASVLASKSATKHKSMGLKITAARIAILQNNGKESPVTINDLVNEDGTAAGTEVIIKMPLIYE